MGSINKNLKVLVIGACGFIGSSLVKKLLTYDYNITAIIGNDGPRYLTGIKDKRLKIYPQSKLTHNYKKLGRFKYLFNLAGYTDIRESFRRPLEYELNKPPVTIKLIEGVKTDKFVNISTASVYDFDYNPVSEKSPFNPASPYAISQLCADYYTQVLCAYHKIPFLILRLFNPYGPPNTQRGIIATIINDLLEDRKVVLYNPSRRFDFTFIDDIVRGIIFCVPKKEGVMNIGCGRPVSLLKVYKKIFSLLFKNYCAPQILKSAKFTEQVFSNSNKLKKSGFHFQYDIDRGLTKTVDYFKAGRK